jgi:hypothetical protein
LPIGLERVRLAAEQDRKQRFTALLHHIYDVDRLRHAYFDIQRNAAAGIDGETWRHYGERLEDNLRDLPDGWREERTGQDRYDGFTSRKRTGGNGR